MSAQARSRLGASGAASTALSGLNGPLSGAGLAVAEMRP